MYLPIRGTEQKNIRKTSSNDMGNLFSVKRRSKSPKSFGTFVAYVSPEEVMAGTKKVRTYKEWEVLLNGELGKIIGII